LKQTFFVFTIFCLFLFACVKEEPVPPEVDLAQAQELDLWRAEARLYLKAPFAQYQETLNQANANLARIRSQFSWFRNYESVRAEFAQLLKQGEELRKELDMEKQRRVRCLQERMNGLEEKLRQLDAFTRTINESGASRGSLLRGEIILIEAQGLANTKQYLAAEEKLNDVAAYLSEAEKVISPVLSRYQDENQIKKWRKWAKETVEESKEKRIYAILVIKESKRLFLYKQGGVFKTYRIGLGRNSWSDKRRAKDNATPEGKYRISGKNPKSRYYKALLINYPNEEDRREFNRDKKRGLLPAAASIGGSIEIHGGGNEGITYGCIALDNRQMEELYDLVEVGTPIAIVGALDTSNNLSSISAAIHRGRTQKETD
jgi:L,D-peptidoglycan transpeptidase YkuD (ErfK/YbiS/YcfS/YnhG family)